MTKGWMWMLVALLLAACQTGATDAPVLPTLADLDAISTDQVVATVLVASPTRRPLPPTFTPSPIVTVTPTDPGPLPTATPEGFRASGTLYYLFNGDAIVELAADASFEDLLPMLHIGQEITGLTAAPDDALLAYVAPGPGSAREVFVTNRQGSSTRQVSQLGFSVVQRPVWRFDGQELAFIAAQAPGTPLGVYIVAADGSGQRRLIELPSTDLRDLAWSSDGRWLFFSNTEIYAVNTMTGELSEPLTAFTGFGPDFHPIHSPTQPQLYYLKMEQDLDTGVRGGVLSFIDTAQLPLPPPERPAAKLYVDSLAYSRDGAYLVIGGQGGIWVQSQAIQTASKIVEGAPVPPGPVFNPDGDQVAYVGLDALSVPQIFLINRQGGESTQITFHQEGTVTDLAWLRG